jgi:hypothetical protein
METLTGFKYIGEKIRQFESSKDYEYVFGFEESYGCLVGTHARDKDGIVAVMMLAEAAAYYNRGQNIVYYCHKGRRNTGQWERAKTMLCEHITDASYAALTFHRGTQRTFIFAIHGEDYDQYYHILNRFLDSAWGKYFTKKTPESPCF